MKEIFEFILKIKDLSFEQILIILVLGFLFYIISILLKKILKREVKCAEHPCIIEVSGIAKDSNSKIEDMSKKCDKMIEKYEEMIRSNKLASQLERIRIMENLDDDTISKIYEIFGDKQR